MIKIVEVCYVSFLCFLTITNGRGQVLFILLIWEISDSLAFLLSFIFQEWRRKEGGCCLFRWSRYLFLLLCRVLISTSFSSLALSTLLFCSSILCHSTRILTLLTIFFLRVCEWLQSGPSIWCRLDFLNFFFGRDSFYCILVQAFCDTFRLSILSAVLAFSEEEEIFHHQCSY